jgi:hypothetical protein
MVVPVKKGFNYLPYNLQITEKGRKAMTKANKDLDIPKAGNGNYYLPKGIYTLKIEDKSTLLEIK